MKADGGIVAEGVRRAFGSVEAVRGMDLRAAPGEVTALIGPNGAGKNTLLLVLATLLRPDAGTVRVAGHDATRDVDAVRANLGWAPDVFGLYDGLTCREYLEFFADAYRLPREAGRRRAAELLERTHLDEFADRPVHVLSRGQKQRLGLARALVHEPTVLVLDEPAAGLDPRSRVELRDLLRGLAAAGAAVLVSSHVLSDLEELADVAVLVDAGRTVAVRRIGELPAVARRWRVRALLLQPLLAALRDTGLPHSEPTPAGVDVELASEDAAARLLASLVAAGVGVSAFAPVGGSLEAEFLSLTSEART